MSFHITDSDFPRKFRDRIMSEKRYVMKDVGGCIFTVTPEYLKLLEELDLGPRQYSLFDSETPVIPVQ
jgi:hypothetical protein